MQIRKYILAAVTLVAAGALGFVMASRRQESLSIPVVRTYQVHPDRADDLKNHLNRVLWTKDHGDGGSAQVFGNGLVLVRATLGYQQGVQRLIEKLANLPPEVRKRVRLDYYMVLSQPNKSSNSNAFIGGLGTVLTSIEKIEGPSHFRVLEHMVTTSLTGEESAAEGAMLKTISYATALQGQLQLKVSLDSWFGKIQTHIDLQSGEFLILGQNAQRTVENRTKAFGEGNVYYILRAEFAK